MNTKVSLIPKHNYRIIHLDYYSKNGSILKLVEKFFLYNLPTEHRIFERIVVAYWNVIKYAMYSFMIGITIMYIYKMQKYYFVLMLMFMYIVHIYLQKQLYLSIL